MSDFNRGAYTPPTDAPLAFDARERPKGRGPAPISLIVSAVVLIALVAAIVYFYRSGMRRGEGGPPEVGQPVAEIKQPATDAAQPSDPAAGLQIYRSEDGSPPPPQPNFVAPPEQPALRPTQPTAPPPAPVAAAPTPTPTATAAPKAATPPPAAKAVTPPPATPAAKPAAPAAPPPAVAAPPAPKPAAGAGAAVQIGALSSQALADAAWSEAARISPGAAAGKGKEVSKVERDGKTFYRTAVTGFASRADAQAFCNSLKAAGKSCFVR